MLFGRCLEADDETTQLDTRLWFSEGLHIKVAVVAYPQTFLLEIHDFITNGAVSVVKHEFLIGNQCFLSSDPSGRNRIEIEHAVRYATFNFQHFLLADCANNGIIDDFVFIGIEGV